MFSYEERLKAVKLLLQYDMSYSTVIWELGYPSKESLRNWYYEYRKGVELHRDFVRNTKYSKEEKQNKPAKEVAAEYGTTRENLYNWKRQPLQGERVHSMDKKDHNKPKKTKAIEAKITEPKEQKDDLLLQVIELRKEVHRL